jgi:ubiquinone/menaquinone biosynthesis C-methylase UbiE
MKIIQENIDRFNGFADTYHSNRPVPPQIITKIILSYLRSSPQTVVDIGSGTGLSTMIWQGLSAKVIGIEPNDDMRAIAENNVRYHDVIFQKGFSTQTELPSDSVDVVTISQAFHWMDMDGTMDEVYRILKTDGIFAVYDCDWPPAVDWVIEQAFDSLHDKCGRISFAKDKPPQKNDKGAYIQYFHKYGRFRFVKEVVCHSVETCTPERMIGLAMSQGSIQDALKIDPSIQNDVNAFRDIVKARCDSTFDIVFSYRLRLAKK